MAIIIDDFHSIPSSSLEDHYRRQCERKDGIIRQLESKIKSLEDKLGGFIKPKTETLCNDII